jgi:hypothetical protein
MPLLDKNRPSGNIASVSIILPVVDGRSNYKVTLESILRHSVGEDSKVLVVNCSRTTHENPLLHHEPIPVRYITGEARSLPARINQGILSSTDDIVVVIPGTLVFTNWLSLLKESVYSHAQGATSVPMTNAGTYSFIDPGSRDTFGKHRSLDSPILAEQFAERSMRLFPEVPLAFGSVMFIRRSALDKIGLLDESLTYLEAQFDFSCRCTESDFVMVHREPPGIG